VKCETNDLMVPASAEIVIEGRLGLDPETYMMEGPYAEFTGYVAGDRSPKPVIHVDCITHRNDPILRGTIEGCMPGSYSENAMISSIFRSSTAWNVLDRAGVPGITDVWGRPCKAGMNLNIRMKQSYRGQGEAKPPMRCGEVRPRMCATSTSRSSMTISTSMTMRRSTGRSLTGSMREKTTSSSCPIRSGLALIPRHASAIATRRFLAPEKWNGVLIDATINLDYDPDPEFGG